MLLQANLAEIGAKTGDRELLDESLARDQELRRAPRPSCWTTSWSTPAWTGRWRRTSLATVSTWPAVLQGIVRLSLPAAEQKGLYLRVQCRARLAMRTDRVKLERILNNLVSNAVKFTEQGGVRIEVERTGHGDRDPRDRHRHRHRARVRRSGCSTNSYQLHNRERDRRKGFGLGLSIARRLARHLGGDVTVEMPPAAGAAFRSCLPSDTDDDSSIIQADRNWVPAGRRPTRSPATPPASSRRRAPARRRRL